MLYLACLVNSVLSLVQLGLSLYMCFDSQAHMVGYRWIGISHLLFALLFFVANGLALAAVFKENRVWMRNAMYLAFLNAFLLVALVGIYVYASANVEEMAREAWFGMSVDSRNLFEYQHGCCGFDTPEDSQSDGQCPYKTPCSKPFYSALTHWLSLGIVLHGASLAVHLLTCLIIWMYYVKMDPRKNRRGVLTQAQKGMSLRDEIALETGKAPQIQRSDQETLHRLNLYRNQRVP